MPLKKGFDPIVLITTVLLIGIGIVMIYSSSAIIAMERYNDPYFFLKRQAIWVAMGSILMALILRLDYRIIRKLTYPAIFITVVLLILLLIPQFSREIGGARRWLHLGPISFQPSELAKSTLILYIAHSLVKNADKLQDFTFGYLPNLVILGLFFLLIFFQPDLGTALIILMVVFTLFFVAGVRFLYIFFSFLMIIPFLCVTVLGVTGVTYQKIRILAFLNPWHDPLGSGFQIIQSFLALGRGNILGLGIGEGKQKLFYLPEPHTDFIFSVIGEELGFVGTVSVIILFAILIWRGVRISIRSQDLFGTYLSLGITMMIGIQAIINMGVAVGLLPTKGIPLPFISLGGSSLIVSMISIGMLLNISENVV